MALHRARNCSHFRAHLPTADWLVPLRLFVPSNCAMGTPSQLMRWTVAASEIRRRSADDMAARATVSQSWKLTAMSAMAVMTAMLA